MSEPKSAGRGAGRFVLFAGILAAAGGIVWLLVQDGPPRNTRADHQHSAVEVGPTPEAMPSRATSLRAKDAEGVRPGSSDAPGVQAPATATTTSPTAVAPPETSKDGSTGASQPVPTLAQRFGVNDDVRPDGMAAGEAAAVPGENAPGTGTPDVAGASGPALEAVRLMLRDYRSISGENPIGTNAEIMQAVMGGNKKGAQLGPPEGQKLNGDGELLDPWGTPYFFHQLSRMEMEIRSAGPDKLMWTGDDLLTK